MDEGVCKRISEELQVWHVDFSLDSFLSTEVSFDSMVVFGLQWEPLEFLEKALEVKHPVDLQEAFAILFKWWVVVGFHLLLLSASVCERRKNKNPKTIPHLF